MPAKLVQGRFSELRSRIEAATSADFLTDETITARLLCCLGPILNQAPVDPMKPTTFTALLCTVLFCSSANADFFIDNFTKLDAVGGGATSIGSNGITVSVTNTSGTTIVDDAGNQYIFQANSGDSFTVSYDWAGIFNDLQSVSGNQLVSSPVSFFGDWTMEIDTGVGSPTNFGPSIPTILPAAIDLDNATELTYTFTYNGGSPLGFGVGAFGGTANPLFATPEPTAFFMLGSAGVILVSRRRRKA